MRAALYVRVSTEDQASEGFSLDAQVKRLEAYCRVRGWDVAGVYRDEGFSGRSTDRPEYRRMMEEMDSWDTILVMKMDRIHRNSVNFAMMMDDLREHGKEFSSMQDKFDTTTAMGRFVMDIMQRIAQLESEQIGERVRIGMEYKARNGLMDTPMPTAGSSSLRTRRTPSVRSTTSTGAGPPWRISRNSSTTVRSLPRRAGSGTSSPSGTSSTTPSMPDTWIGTGSSARASRRP